MSADRAPERCAEHSGQNVVDQLQGPDDIFSKDGIIRSSLRGRNRKTSAFRALHFSVDTNETNIQSR